MNTCTVWPNGAPCGSRAVETLVHLNPLCGGTGFLHVCPRHLAEYLSEHLLVSHEEGGS